MKTLSGILSNFIDGKSYLQWVKDNQENYLNRENMNNIELVSYKTYENDVYTKAICCICLDGKYLVSYGKKVGKDGQSWWKPASFSVDEGSGSKKYVDCFCMDSNKANEQILDFIRNAEKTQAPRATSMSEVAANNGLPF